jgi:hypothetical protein
MTRPIFRFAYKLTHVNEIHSPPSSNLKHPKFDVPDGYDEAWGDPDCGQCAGKKGRTSSTFLRIDRNLVVRASRFLARSECPVCAPFSLNFVFVKAIRVGKTFSLGPAPDMFA